MYGFTSLLFSFGCTAITCWQPGRTILELTWNLQYLLLVEFWVGFAVSFWFFTFCSFYCFYCSSGGAGGNSKVKEVLILLFSFNITSSSFLIILDQQPSSILNSVQLAVVWQLKMRLRFNYMQLLQVSTVFRQIISRLEMLVLKRTLVLWRENVCGG